MKHIRFAAVAFAGAAALFSPSTVAAGEHGKSAVTFEDLSFDAALAKAAAAGKPLFVDFWCDG